MTLLTWIPGDGEYDLDEILAELDLLGSSDIVLFRRNVRDQLGRNVVSSLMYSLIRVLFRFNARGYCGIFLIGRTRWESLEIGSRDVFFTLEVAIRAACRDWRIAYGVASGPAPCRQIEGLQGEHGPAQRRRAPALPNGCSRSEGVGARRHGRPDEPLGRPLVAGCHCPRVHTHPRCRLECPATS